MYKFNMSIGMFPFFSYWIVFVIFCIAGCDNIFSGPMDSRAIDNNQYVFETISKLKEFKNSNGFLPKSLNELTDYTLLPDREIWYSNKGIKDISGDNWLVILKDQKIQEVYFVGTINKQMIIRRYSTEKRIKW